LHIAILHTQTAPTGTPICQRTTKAAKFKTSKLQNFKTSKLQNFKWSHNGFEWASGQYKLGETLMIMVPV